MKQKEADTILNRVIKKMAKQFGWKSKGGFLFQCKGKLFFTITIVSNAKSSRLFYRIDYKYFEFDKIFWDIMKMSANANAPFSLHADGAFTAPTMGIKDESIEIERWDDEYIESKLQFILDNAIEQSSALSQKILTTQDNLAYLEECLGILRTRYPDSPINIYVQKVLTAILNEDYKLALEIVDDRIMKKDIGGFSSGSKSFYELAKEYIEQKGVF